MLFTDGTPADIDTLRGYESAILDVAAGQGIDLDTKLELAAEQIGDELEAWLALRPSFRGTLPAGLDAVVVSPALRRWHAAQTLELIYRDAYYQDLNDRYKGKWQMYRGLRAEAREQYFLRGVGLCGNPVAKGPTAQLSVCLGMGETGTIYARATWVNAQGSEGIPGELRSYDVPAGSSLVATIGQRVPAGYRWNLYAGTREDDLTLQNAQPLDPAATWIQTGSLTQGTLLPAGQLADYWMAENRRLVRG